MAGNEVSHSNIAWTTKALLCWPTFAVFWWCIGECRVPLHGGVSKGEVISAGKDVVGISLSVRVIQSSLVAQAHCSGWMISEG